MSDIVQLRLHNQRIVCPASDQPGIAVAWMGAVQAQEYASAKWAIGLRCAGATETTVDQAIASGSIVRTWLLRGTLHFVAAQDVRWMLALLGPRLIANSARRHAQLELDAATLARSRELLAGALQGGRSMTRTDAMQTLEETGVSTEGQRGYHLLRYAALSGAICFGPMQGGEATFVLLDEWIPAHKQSDGDAALAELAVRYFQSHGPATLHDFAWWSGLRMVDVHNGIEHAGSLLRSEKQGSREVWQAGEAVPTPEPSASAHLLPAFDEYYLGYRDRTSVLDPTFESRAVSSNGVFRPMILVDGQVTGIWRQSRRKSDVMITLDPFKPLTSEEDQAIAAAAERYGAYLGQPVALSAESP